MTSKVTDSLLFGAPLDPEHVRLAIDLLRVEMFPPDGLVSVCPVRFEMAIERAPHAKQWPRFIFAQMRNPNQEAANAQIARALEIILFAARENMLNVVPVDDVPSPPNSISICTPLGRHCLSSKPCAIHEIPHRGETHEHRGETHELTPTKNNGTASPEARIKLLEARIEKLEGGSPRRARSDLLAW